MPPVVQSDSDDGRVIVAFWSAIDLLRPLVWVYVAYQYSARLDEVAHPERGWAILALLGVWTAVGLARKPRTRLWFAAELAIGVGAILGSEWVDSRVVIEGGAPTVPGMWPAATVLAWAVLAGPLGGLIAAAIVAAADLVLIRTPSDFTFHNIVILLMVGALVGYCAVLARDGQRAAREAAELHARVQERERLARTVHDGVLQALSLVHRRGLEVGGETAELGRLAAEQERRLRELIRVPMPALEMAASENGDDGDADLAALLTARAGESVTVVDPGRPVLMGSSRAAEIDAAVGAALDNVARHAGPGARAWVLLEELEDQVIVTVRDNGCGTTDERLRSAEAEGRLGVSSCIVGRMADIGGSARIETSPRGTLVELTAPLGSERPNLQEER